jgi:hypothetical protein
VHHSTTDQSQTPLHVVDYARAVTSLVFLKLNHHAPAGAGVSQLARRSPASSRIYCLNFFYGVDWPTRDARMPVLIATDDEPLGTHVLALHQQSLCQVL